MTPEEADAFLGDAGKPKGVGEFSPAEADSFLGNVAPALPTSYGGDVVAATPEQDHFIAQSGIGRVLDAFGQGVKQGWGAGSLGLDPQTEETLRKVGILPDVQKGQTGIVRAFNEAAIRPAAAALDAVIRAGSAAIGGVTSGGAQAATEIGGEQFGRGVGGVLEATFADLGSRIGPHGAPEPVRPAAILDRARAENIIGQPDPVWRGTGEPVPSANENLPRVERPAEPVEAAPLDTAAAAGVPQPVAPGMIRLWHGGNPYEGGSRWLTPSREQAAGYASKAAGGRGVLQYVDVPKDDPRLVPSFDATGTDHEAPPVAFDAPPEMAQGLRPWVEAPEPPAAAPSDVHGLARQIAPETFQEYDGLAEHKDSLRQQIDAAQDELRQKAEAQAPGAAEIARLQERLQDTTPRLRKKYQARLDELMPDYQAFMADDFTLGALTRDTPEIAALRQQLAETDYRMRDLAPQVTDAYRKASEQMPTAEPVAAPPPEPTAEPTPAPAPEQAPQPEAPAPAPEAPPQPEPVQQPPAAPVQSIAADVAQKLRAAGRPAEEATAAAQVTEALWRTRAAAFEGAKGTAEEMYAREAPDIRAGRERARQPEMAQAPRTGAQGKIRLTEDGRAVITLMKSANASTYLHEMGHDWLERQMRDAADPAAPDRMRQDAATVRSYLGVQPDGELTRQAHEKFARSFERYFMEGRAPSQALAGVFGQFKQWLTAIYQSVARLRAPITADIRDVFDRMLTTEPDRTSVVPEEPGPSLPEPTQAPAQGAPVAVTSQLADLHEADAATTPPADAAPAAAHVRQETETASTTHAPEVTDAVQTKNRAGKAAGRGAAEGGRDRGDAEGPGPAGGAPNGVPEPAAELPGGGGAAGEGNRARGAEPASPATPLPRPDDGLIDKAGNIRLDNLNTPDDVSQVIRDAAAQSDDYLAERRGVVSDAQVIDLADALGMTPSDLGRRRIGEAFNAEQVMAARKLLVQSATEVRDLMAKAAHGTDADVLAYGEARARHLMIQGQVSGITAEAGRALRAFRDLGQGGEAVKSLNEFLQGATGKTLFQMRREAQMGMALDTPGQVSRFIGDSAKPTFGDMALEYWINGLISGPATHTTYAIGNALLAFWKAGPETAVAAAIGKARSIFKTDAERVYGGEVGAGLYALLKGQRDGVRAAWKAAKSGVTEPLPGENSAFTAASMGALPQGAIPGKLGTVIRLPSRGVASIHSYFRTIGYEQAIAAQAYRTAAKEGLRDQAFAARIADLTTNPPPDMMEAARREATDQTLMSNGGEFTRKLADLTNTPILGFRLLKVVDPFVKISSNIISQALLERSPLGLLDPEIRANIMGRNGAIARDTQIARIAVGSSLATVVVGLAAQDLITGAGPSNPKEAAVWRLTGRQPYSVRIGDTWYETHRLGPLGMLLGIGADMYEFGHAAQSHELDQIGGMLVTSLAKNLMHESFMRGPAQLIEAVDDSDRYGSRYVSTQLATLLPFSTAESQIARAMDPYARSARGLMDTIIARVPGASQSLYPRRDLWGQKLPNPHDLGMDGVTSIAESRVNNDPVNRALLRLHIFPGMPSRDLAGVPLNQQQYDDYSRISGVMSKQRLDALVNQPGFDLLPPGVQTKAITGVIEHTRHAAGELVKMQNPAIISQALKNRSDFVTEGRKPR